LNCYPSKMCSSGYAGVLAVIEVCVFWCWHPAGAWETIHTNTDWNITLHV